MNRKIYCNRCNMNTEHVVVKPTGIEKKVIAEVTCQVTPIYVSVYRCVTCGVKEFHQDP